MGQSAAALCGLAHIHAGSRPNAWRAPPADCMDCGRHCARRTIPRPSHPYDRSL